MKRKDEAPSFIDQVHHFIYTNTLQEESSSIYVFSKRAILFMVWRAAWLMLLILLLDSSLLLSRKCPRNGCQVAGSERTGFA